MFLNKNALTKSRMIDIDISTSKKQELVDITPKIKKIVSESKVKEGLCIIYCPHTTAGLTINENADPDVKKDIIMALEKIVPENADYSHAEGNSTAHIKSSILGNSLNILVKNSKLFLGTWQGILFFEGDGPRNRKVIINIIKNH